MNGNGYDPFDSLTKLCFVSDSQEDILRHCPFAGDPKSVHASAFPTSHILHLHPTHAFTASPPETLDQREQMASPDANQPPPEQAGGHRPMAVDDPPLQDAAAGVEGENVSDVATGVDLEKNNDLGFLEVQSTEQTDEIEIIGVPKSKISESHADGEAEPASKKLKSWNEGLGKDSSVRIVIENLLKSSRESILIGKSVPVGEESGEETHRNKKKKEKMTEKEVENSEAEESGYLNRGLNCDPWREALGLRMNESNSQERNDASSSVKSIVMEILKIVSNVEKSESDKKLEDMTLFEIARSRGMNFPRPCWWPEEYDG